MLLSEILLYLQIVSDACAVAANENVLLTGVHCTEGAVLSYTQFKR